MHDRGALTWREVVNRHHSTMVDDLAERLDSEIQEAVRLAVAAERAEAAVSMERARMEAREIAREGAVRVTSETLNQILRRLRQAAAEGPALELLAEGSAPWAERAVVLSFKNHQSRDDESEINQAGSISTRGLSSDEVSFTFDVETAEAIALSIDSGDPVISLVTAAALSPALAAALSDGSGGKAYLFPVVSRQNVTAMLVASGAVTPAPLELLCEAAGIKLEALAPGISAAPAKNPELVQIAAPAPPGSQPAARLTWDDLSPEDQKLHLQAQRVARVRVAEMRLDHPEELRRGLFSGDLYGALRNEIDKARTEFLQTFLSKSSTMVDYLHLEILRSLAHEDDRILGHEYPGPMV